MKIKSKFKDYYDGVFYNGQGEEFLRLQSNTTINNKDISILLSGLDTYYYNRKRETIGNKKKYPDLYYTLLLFCGEIFIIETSNGNGLNKMLDKDKTNVLSLEELNNRIMIEDPDPTGYKFRLSSHKKIYVISDDKIENIHIEFNSPILLIDKHTNVTINPKLDNFHFGRIYDANQAHQKIEMYIANFLFRRDNAIVPVGDDKTRIVSAGFDLKTSFRNIKDKVTKNRK